MLNTLVILIAIACVILFLKMRWTHPNKGAAPPKKSAEGAIIPNYEESTAKEQTALNFKLTVLETATLRFNKSRIPSKTEWKFRTDGTGKTYYSVDLENVTCTCDEFLTRRQKYSSNDVRRLCGHLIRAHQKAGTWGEQEEIIEAMIFTGPASGGCWTYDQIHKTSLKSGESVYFGTRKKKKWVDVYTRKRKNGETAGVFSGAYDKFGFDREEKKWSYGSGPPAAREIRDYLKYLPLF